MTAQFISLYHHVKNAGWDKEPEGIEVEFELGGRERKVLFSSTGILLSVEEEINATGLPQQVLKYVQEHFADHTLDEACLVKVRVTVKYRELGIKPARIHAYFPSSRKYKKQYFSSILQRKLVTLTPVPAAPC